MSEGASLRKASCASDISSVNCKGKKASEQRSKEYLSKIEIRAKSQAKCE